MDNQIRYTVTANDMLSGKLQGMNTEANRLNGGMDSLNGTISKIGSAIGVAFGLQQISNFAQKVVSAGTTVENATTGLTTLLGDAGEATRVIQNTMQDATKTPFAFEGLLNANKALIGAGVNADKARADVLNLANAISATGGGDEELGRMVVNMQQISNTGKASTEDIKQFAFAGINIYKVLAEATGQPIAKVKDMSISYDMLTMALEKAHEKGGIYYNGLENMANNTSVKISNVGDALFQSFVEIFQKIKPYVDGGLGFINDMLSSAKNNIGAYFDAMVSFFKPLINPIRELFDKIVSSVRKVYDSLSQFSSEGGSILEFIRDAIGGLITAFGYLYEYTFNFVAGVIDVFHTIYVILEKLGIIWVIKTGFELVWTVLQGIGSALKSLYDNVINPIFEKIMWAYNKVKELLGIKDKKITVSVDKKEELNTSSNMSKLKKTTNIDNASLPTKTKGTSGVSGSKVITVNVTIGNLINDFRIQTTNIQESTTAIKDKVLQALTSAVNDSQLIAGS